MDKPCTLHIKGAKLLQEIEMEQNQEWLEKKLHCKFQFMCDNENRNRKHGMNKRIYWYYCTIIPLIYRTVYTSEFFVVQSQFFLPPPPPISDNTITIGYTEVAMYQAYGAQHRILLEGRDSHKPIITRPNLIAQCKAREDACIIFINYGTCNLLHLKIIVQLKTWDL